jgi:hypothetical protein
MPSEYKTSSHNAAAAAAAAVAAAAAAAVTAITTIFLKTGDRQCYEFKGCHESHGC